MCQRIVRMAVSCLINLTKCESQLFGREDPRSDFATKQIINYERSNMEPSFWVWVSSHVMDLLEGESP